MDWVFAVFIVILLIIISFIFLIFMPKPRVFFDPYTNATTIFPQFHDEISKEICAGNSDMPVIPIYGFGEIMSDEYPITYQLLRAMPYVRFAGIINIKQDFEQKREYGFDKVANHTIRYFYTIKQSATQKSGIWIDGEKRFFTEKEWICGDMSREHALFNKNKRQPTTVLFIDIDRHESINEGASPNKELDKDEVLKMFALVNVN
jgi:hypothetical protein